MLSKIILYPFSRASGENIAYDTGALIMSKFEKYFTGKRGVSDQMVMTDARNEPSERKNDVNNFDNLKYSLENLFNEQCKTAWSGERPVTIGGDHSQGFATVKSTLFIPVLKDVVNGKLGKNLSGGEKDELKAMADRGDFISAYKKIDELVEANKISQFGIKRITDKIHVIWMDAHADFNTAHISGSKNFHGMSLAAACTVGKKHLLRLCGLKDEEGRPALTDTQINDIKKADKLFGGIEDIGSKYIKASPKRIHILGTRDLDFVEEMLMMTMGVDYQKFEMHNTALGKIRAQGQSEKEVCNTFNKAVASVIEGIKHLGHKYMLSFDIDLMSVPETGTPLGSKKNVRKNRFDNSPVGPNRKDCFKAMENLSHDKDCLAFDLTEVSTRYKTGGVIKRGLQALTAGLCVLASFFGGEEARKETMQEMKTDGVLKHLHDTFKKTPDIEFSVR